MKKLNQKIQDWKELSAYCLTSAAVFIVGNAVSMGYRMSAAYTACFECIKVGCSSLHFISFDIFKEKVKQSFRKLKKDMEVLAGEKEEESLQSDTNKNCKETVNRIVFQQEEKRIITERVDNSYYGNVETLKSLRQKLLQSRNNEQKEQTKEKKLTIEYTIQKKNNLFQ